ncbi:hypothetical protein [Paenibacillus flagellatus]|uniref:HEAT repeat domain-containing protein n=1 Tax=Paenibacillus flagellatus TaxID=2211139 RepID=A0A2V5JXM4_9BACL|nr:hypothetical protein [Paenibacillus flagellatus]PYI51022.1 hypothetical protein DLM86_27030 [Paenibacillus flagellatus]
MSVLDKLAVSRGLRDESANVELAESLARSRDAESIAAIVRHLDDPNKAVRHDCIKVLYEIGAAAPELVADYADRFLALLKSRDNRLVWGAMTGLAAVAEVRADELYERVGDLYAAVRGGSVITVDNGILALSRIAAANEEYGRAIEPFLLEHLAACRAKDVPPHAENIAAAIRPDRRDAFADVLLARKGGLSAAQSARVDKLLKRLAAAGTGGGTNTETYPRDK